MILQMNDYVLMFRVYQTKEKVDPLYCQQFFNTPEKMEVNQIS